MRLPFRGRGYRLRAAHAAALYFGRPHPERECEVYWLSTGRCGTHYVASLLAHAANVNVIHERGSVAASVHRYADLWTDSPLLYLSTAADFWTRAKLAANARLPGAIYTELTHAITPVAWQMFCHLRSQGRRAKFVHLIRKPVDCCRSMLKVERYEGGQGFAHRPRSFTSRVHDDEPYRSARVAADAWSATNELADEVVTRICGIDCDAARTVRVEDLRQEGPVRALFDWLGATQPAGERLREFLAAPPARAVHSHLGRALQTADATDEELFVVKERTRALATRLGYD